MGAQEFQGVREDGPNARLRLASADASPCFFRYFIASVQAAGGRFIHIKTGNARPQQAAPAGTGGLGDGPKALSAMGALRAIPTVECPEVAYQQGAADLCAAYGLASAMHEYGDTSGAAAIAACACAALTVQSHGSNICPLPLAPRAIGHPFPLTSVCADRAGQSNDAFGNVRDVVNDSVAGWDVAPISGHDPLAMVIDAPVNLQLVGSDGAGTHAVATLGGLVFDASEARALPLSRAALDHCVGAQLNGARFSHVARAVRLVPGKSLRKRLRREAGGSA